MFKRIMDQWLTDRIKRAATMEGREIEGLQFKIPMYLAEDIYADGIATGYISKYGKPTTKFEEDYSHAIISFGVLKVGQ